MASAQIVEANDVLEDGGFGIAARLQGVLVQSAELIVLKNVWTAALSYQFLLPLVVTLDPASRRIFWHSCEQYWLRRSA